MILNPFLIVQRQGLRRCSLHIFFQLALFLSCDFMGRSPCAAPFVEQLFLLSTCLHNMIHKFETRGYVNKVNRDQSLIKKYKK